MKAKAVNTDIVAAPKNDPTGGSLATAEDSSLCAAGEWGSEDYEVPMLAIVHNVGKLKREFAVGSWVLGKAVEIAAKDTPFKATCVRLEKYYREQFDIFDSGNMPQQFQTEVDAKAAGLKKHEPRTKKDGTYAAAALVDWLIECPEEYGMYEYEGKHMTRCRMYMQGTAYPIARKVLTAGIGPVVKGAFYKLDLALHTEIVSSETNDWPEPRLKRNGMADPAFIEWIEKNVI
jgi:hypothetical protein